MRHATEQAPRGPATLVWGVRRMAWLILGFVLAGAVVLPKVTATDAPTFQATALIVVRQIAVKPAVLPPLAKAVFSSDAMVRRVSTAATAAGLTNVGGRAGLIPDRVGLVAAEDSIVLVVLGRSDDPGQAAQLADLGAAAFVDELNRIGSGVATFAVDSRARVPAGAADDQGPPMPLMAVAGGTAGLLIGLSLLWAVARLRRPLLDRTDVETRLGTRLLGTVIAPAAKPDRTRVAQETTGVASVARALLRSPYTTVILVSSSGTGTVRRFLLGLLPPILYADGSAADHTADGQAYTTVADMSDLDVAMTVRQDDAGIVLVLRYGAPAGPARRVLAHYRSSDICGVVMVDRRHRVTWPAPTARRPGRSGRMSRNGGPADPIPPQAGVPPNDRTEHHTVGSAP